MYFFFFQAEDGIRDIGVTGVQTCALSDLRRSWRPARHLSNRRWRARSWWGRCSSGRLLALTRSSRRMMPVGGPLRTRDSSYPMTGRRGAPGFQGVGPPSENSPFESPGVHRCLSEAMQEAAYEPQRNVLLGNPVNRACVLRLSGPRTLATGTGSE